MKTTCKYCGIVENPHSCPHKRRRTDRNRIDNKIYESDEYRNLHKDVLADYNHIDIWCMYVHCRVVRGNITHHVIEIIEDESLALEYDNLIPVNDRSHKEIHILYKDLKIKRLIQALQTEMAKDFLNGDRTVGKYKEQLENIFQISPPPFDFFYY